MESSLYWEPHAVSRSWVLRECQPLVQVMSKGRPITCFLMYLNLDISLRTMVGNRDVPSRNNVMAFSFMLPNLEEIDLSYARVPGNILLRACRHCSKLRRIEWNGSRREIDIQGASISLYSKTEELYLDNSVLYTLGASARELHSAERGDQNGLNLYMFCLCSCLERLSIKNVTWFDEHNRAEEGPISQEMLIKMVRHHPTLRWLRSDLTEENIAMLKQERPEITFVSK